MNLSKTDQKILELLTENGRISYVELAEKVGLSRVGVRERVNQLIEKGIIENFTVVINSEKIGKQVSAFFNVDCEPTKLVEVAKKLAENPDVITCVQMTGRSRLHIHVLVENFSKLEEFTNEELYTVEGITRVESHILMRRFQSKSGLKI